MCGEKELELVALFRPVQLVQPGNKCGPLDLCGMIPRDFAGDSENGCLVDSCLSFLGFSFFVVFAEIVV